MKENKKLWVFGGAALLAALLFATQSKEVTDTIIHYSLTQDTADKIKLLHPAVRQRFYNFVREIQERLGYNVKITSSYRTFADQIRLHNENASNAKPGYSFHNFGMAIDINLQKGNTVIKKASSKSDWQKSGVLEVAEKNGLSWGGEFSNYYDPVHFDARKLFSMDELRRKALVQFGSIEAAKGNEVNI